MRRQRLPSLRSIQFTPAAVGCPFTFVVYNYGTGQARARPGEGKERGNAVKI